MENETDVIRNQMLETRTALSEKLEALQEQVVSTVQGTTASVAETVQAVTETVQDTVSTVSESVQDTVQSVKSTFDITQHVENYPWAMFGGALALGFLGGRLLPSAGTLTGAAASVAPTLASHLTVPATQPAPASAAASAAPSSAADSGSLAGSLASTAGNWLGGLGESLEPIAREVQGLAVGTLTGLVGEMVLGSTPDAFRGQVKDILHQLTTALGGKPVEGLMSDNPQPGASAAASTKSPSPPASPSHSPATPPQPQHV